MRKSLAALLLCLCIPVVVADDLWGTLLPLFEAAGQFKQGNAAYDRGEFAEALRLLRPLADEGNPHAQGIVGIMYAAGNGVPQDYAESAKWFRLAADRGEAQAQFLLGGQFDTGRGVPQDYGEAVKWYRLAAEQGVGSAQLNLGVMYAKGHGVPQDDIEAHKWLNLAAATANDPSTRELAAKNRDAMASMMAPDQIAEAQRRAREWKPAPP